MASATFKRDDKGNGGLAVSQMEEKARETMASGVEKVKEFGSDLVEKADSAAASVGGNIRSVSDAIKKNAPREGVMGSASGAVAGTIEQAGRYLEEQGVSGAADDFTNLIRKNPIPAVLVGIGIGFLLARVVRS